MYLKDPLSPLYIYSLFFSLQVLMPYANVFVFHYDDLQYLKVFKTDIEALKIAFLTCGAYTFFWLVGFLFVKIKLRIPVVTSIGTRLSRKSLVLSAGVTIVCTSLVIFFLANGSTGPRSGMAQGASGKVLYVLVVFLITLFWILLITHQENIRRLKKVSFENIFIILVLIISIIGLSSLGGRGRAIFVILGVIFITHYNIKRYSVKQVFYLFSILFISGAYLTIVKLNLSLTELQLILEFLFGPFGGRNFDGIFNVSAIISNINFPIGMGRGMVAGAISDITSIDITTSREVLMREIFGVTGELKFGVNPTKVGEILINFGYFGIIPFAIFYGALSREVYRLFVLKKVFGDYSPIFYFLICYYHGASHIDQYISEKIIYLFMLISSYSVYMIFLRGYSRMRVDG